jgi:hypothetical protein
MLSVKRKRGRPKREPGAMSEKDVVYSRFKALKSNNVRIPMHARPYVEALMVYLTGKGSLDFEAR